MKKTTIKSKHFSDSLLYHQDLYVIWDCTKEEAKKWIEEKFNVTMDVGSLQGFCVRFVHTKGYECAVIWLGSFDWSIEDQTTLIHELQHFVIKTLRERGIEINEHTEEAYTYYFDYWMGKVYKYFSDLRKKDDNRKRAGIKKD